MNEEMNRYELRMFSHPDLELGGLDYSSLLPISIGGDAFSNSIERYPLTWI